MSHTTLVILFGLGFIWLAVLSAWVAGLSEKVRKHRHAEQTFR